MARSLMDRPRPGGPPTERTDGFDTADVAVRDLIRKQPVVCEPSVPLSRAKQCPNAT